MISTAVKNVYVCIKKSVEKKKNQWKGNALNVG